MTIAIDILVNLFSSGLGSVILCLWSLLSSVKLENQFEIVHNALNEILIYNSVSKVRNDENRHWALKS